MSDLGLNGLTRYYYRLEEDRVTGPRRLIATDFARPLHSSGVMGTVRFVGSGGFPGIDDALQDDGPAGATIVVAPGTYAPFTIDRPVRILADGRGPVVIDTSSGKVRIKIPPGVDDPEVVLSGITFGDANSPNGVEIVDTDAVVVLDQVTIEVLPGVDSLWVDNSPKVALQSSAL